MAERKWLTRLARSSLWLFVGLLLGRIAGFFRDVLLAARFGAGSEADVAILMLTLPDFLVNILVGGGLSVALIPAFKRYGAGPRAHCLFVQSSIAVTLLFAGVALLLTIFSEPLTHLVAPGFSTAQVAAAAPLLNVSLWLVPLTILAGVSTAYLHANNRFAVASFGTFTFNAVILLGLGYSIAIGGSLHSLALFILAAGLVRWVIQLLAVPSSRFSTRCLRWRLIDRALVRRYLQAMTAGGFLLLLPVVARAMASLQGEGGLSLFSYAMKLVEFPLGIGVMVLSVSIYPLLSQCFVRREKECGEMVATGLHAVLLITVAMMLPLAWLADDFARLIFERGAMESQHAGIIGQLLALGVLALPLQGVASILTAAYNAARDTAFVMRLNLVAVVLFALAGYWSATRLGLLALMATLVAVHGALVLTQLLALRRRLSLNILGLISQKKVAFSLMMMMMSGAGMLALLQMLQLGMHMNVVLAMLIGACMLLVGLVAGGSHRSLIAMLLKRAPQ